MTEIERLLRKVMRKIMAEPKMMKGYDISDAELLYVIETKKLPLDVFLHVTGDYAFFFAEARRLGITEKEARQLKGYFESINPEEEIKYLKKLFPFIDLKME
jgi:hypothetical protein